MVRPIQFPTEDHIWEILTGVNDPELPFLSIVELKMVRSVSATEHSAKILLTPTFIGCPALDYIKRAVKDSIAEKFPNLKVEVESVLDSVWSVRELDPEVKKKLLENRISLPGDESENETICPYCQSKSTNQLSYFGATACKSLYKCHSCQMPFEQFKCPSKVNLSSNFK